jgi:glycosyltransferase involved in cell wall biosynthesis
VANDKTSPLRVAFLTDCYPRRNETFIHREIEALRAQGVDIDALSLWRPSASESTDGTEHTSTFYLDGVSPLEAASAHARRLTRSPREYVRVARLAWRMTPAGEARPITAIRRFTAAVVLADRMVTRGLTHIHNHATGESCTVALLAAAFEGIDFSFTIHGPGVFFAPVARRLPEKLRRARFVRCISRFTRSQCLMWTTPDRWAALHVVHCGVDPHEYDVRDHDGPGTHVVFIGRLAAEKGVPILLDAFTEVHARRPSVHLTIVGDGRERWTLETRARALGIAGAVRFTGYQTPNQVRHWLHTADVVVLPSLAEGVPVVLMEAMASGVPVVATRVGGVSELVDDGVSGFLVTAGEPDPLAERIETLLGDASLRNRYGHAGRTKVAREFNLASEAAKLRTLMTSAFTGATAAPPSEHDLREAARG